MRSKRLLIGTVLLLGVLAAPFAGTSQNSLTMNTQFSIEFAYSKDAYIIVATASGGGVITPYGSRTVAAGEDITFSFTPALGYHVSAVAIDGQPAPDAGGAGAYRFLRVMDDHTIHVVFAANAQTTPTPAPSGQPGATPTTAPSQAPTTAPPLSGTVAPATTTPVRAVTGGGSSGGGAGRTSADATPVPSPSPTPSQGPSAAPDEAQWDDMPILESIPRNLGLSPD